MYDRILVPLDGSELAEGVLRRVPELTRRPDSTLTLFRAVGYPVGLAEEAHAYLDGVASRLQAEGTKVRTLVGIGSPAESIVDLAASEGMALIAMSSHGRTGLPRWVLGSVTEKVVRASPVPVLVTRAFPPEPRAVRKILVPLDGSDLSMKAVPHAIEFARMFGARLVLAHAFPAGPRPNVPQQVERPLAAAYALVQRAGVAVEEEFREGDPAGVVADLCRDTAVDMIAMTTHGRSGVTRWVLGSVAERVLRHAQIPVLVVRS